MLTAKERGGRKDAEMGVGAERVLQWRVLGLLLQSGSPK